MIIAATKTMRGEPTMAGGRGGGQEQRRAPDRGRRTPWYVLFLAGDSQCLLRPGHNLDTDQLEGHGVG